MDAISMLNRVKGCFKGVPEFDSRAKIGPRMFLVSLVLAFSRNDNTRSLDCIRQSITGKDGIILARSTFWQRLSSNRLKKLLAQTAASLIKSLSSSGSGPLDELAKSIGVKDILGYDSCSTTLPDGAADDFPGTRTNVAPAAFKWHNLMSLVSGAVLWYAMSEAKLHDRKCFPPLKLLAGRLILFDLGYWDFGLLRNLIAAKAFFLSRVKANAVIEIIKVTSGLNMDRYIGQDLLRCKLPKKGRQATIDLEGKFGGSGHDPITLRIVGFWNYSQGCYHWYTTNLTVSAELMYPLYRLRWQLELAFKASKSSFRLADTPSTNSNIIETLLLANIVATLIAFPLAKIVSEELPSDKRTSVSLQRSAKLMISIAGELYSFLIERGRGLGDQLIVRIKNLTRELYDPNYKKRASTGRLACDLARSLE